MLSRDFQGQALSSCSPSATFQSFPHREAFTSIQYPGFCRGHPLTTWLSCHKGLYFWVPRNCNNWRNNFGWLMPLGHCIGSRLKHTFCEKGLICLSQSFGLRGRLLDWYTFRGLLKCTLVTEAGDTIFVLPSALLQDASISWKELTHFLLSNHFVIVLNPALLFA